MQKSQTLQKLLELLKTENHVFIQTHNFPDHDAVASARALQDILSHFRISSDILYDGIIERNSLKRMIHEFKIDIRHYSHFDLSKKDKIIIVDGCKGNRNVSDLIGEEIAVIDHHPVQAPDDVKFSDIRPNFGSCAGILYTYYQELKLPISSDIASVLMIAIHTDTAGMTRHTSHQDLLAYTELHKKGERDKISSILRNNHHLSDLVFYKKGIQNLQIKDKIAFCHFPKGCPQNLLGIIGDFFLSLDEVDFVILSAKNGNRINFSLRSENPELHCGILIAKALQGIGSGGGHAEMAGGLIENDDYNPDHFFKLFLELT